MKPSNRRGTSHPASFSRFQRYFLRLCCTPPPPCIVPPWYNRQTLAARAIRLESSARRVQLEAEKEMYRAMTVAKRRRASGPKNVSEFMRQTIRNREKRQERCAARGQRRSTTRALQFADTAPRMRVFSTPDLPRMERTCPKSAPPPVDHGRSHGRARSAGANRRHASLESSRKVCGCSKMIFINITTEYYYCMYTSNYCSSTVVIYGCYTTVLRIDL